MFRTALIVALASTYASAQQPADWPHWRGPDRNWISQETAWSSSGAEEPVWTRELGLGYSAVIAVDGKLVTMGFELSEDGQTGEDVTWCLDAKTGEVLWSERIPSTHLANAHGGGTLSSPTVEGDRVYTTNRFGKFFCRDLNDGSVIWERDYGAELGLESTTWGFSASPLLLDDSLYITLGGTTLRASKESGEVIWKTENYGENSYTNAMPMTLNGRDVLAVLAGPGLLIANRDTGEEMHRVPWAPAGGGINIATPTPVGEDKLFLATGYNHGGALFDLSGDEPEEIWRNRFRNKIGDAVVMGDYAYGFDESMLKCISMEDGSDQWRVRGLGMGAISASADGRLVVLSSKGELIIAEANPAEFKELSRQKVLSGRGESWTPPLIYDGKIYVRNSLGDLACIDHSGGESLAEQAAPAGPLPDAGSLFAEYTRAIGGESAWSAVTSIHAEGEYIDSALGIQTSELTLDRIQGHAWRQAAMADGLVWVRAFDGEHGYLLDPYFGNRVFEGRELDDSKGFADFHADMMPAKAYATAETTGLMEFNSTPAWKVNAVTRDGIERTLYFDRDSGYLIGRESATEAMVTFEDHKLFGDLVFPGQITVANFDTGAQEISKFDRVTFGTVDSAVFEKPEALIQMLRSPDEVAAMEAQLRAEFAEYLGAYEPLASIPQVPGDLTIIVHEGSLAIEVAPGFSFPIGSPDESGAAPVPAFGGAPIMFERDTSGKIMSLTMPSPDGSMMKARKRD